MNNVHAVQVKNINAAMVRDRYVIPSLGRRESKTFTRSSLEIIKNVTACDKISLYKM